MFLVLSPRSTPKKAVEKFHFRGRSIGLEKINHFIKNKLKGKREGEEIYHPTKTMHASTFIASPSYIKFVSTGNLHNETV